MVMTRETDVGRDPDRKNDDT